MNDSGNIIEFDDLHTYFFTDAGFRRHFGYINNLFRALIHIAAKTVFFYYGAGVVKAVDGVTFSIPEGATVGVVGESGCGKSVTSLSTMQLVQGPESFISVTNSSSFIFLFFCFS